MQGEKYEGESSTLVPVDANRTKDKIFAGIDLFIEEYAGEDLRRAAVRDAKKYSTAYIKNEVKKQDREQKKINALSLTPCIIIVCGSVELIMEHKIGVTSKEIKAKGFTHAKQI